MITAPLLSSALLPPPLSITLPGCPSRSAPPALVVWGAGRRFYGASWMNGYPAVPECGMKVVFVRCRRQLKYIIKEMYMTAPYPCHRSPSGQQVAANLVNLCEFKTAKDAEYAEHVYFSQWSLCPLWLRLNRFQPPSPLRLFH